jgi:hypothetical protein
MRRLIESGQLPARVACLAGALVLSAPVAADPAPRDACARRIAAWQAFAAGGAEVDWNGADWPQRTRRLMDALWRDGESGIAACRTRSRPWTDSAYTWVAVSFVYHQPPRVPDYPGKLRGLVAEVIANLRHEQQRPAPAAAVSSRPSGYGIRYARSGLSDSFPLLAAAQSVPPHCIPKPLPDVRDCGTEAGRVAELVECYQDNLNDIAYYSGWEKSHLDRLKGEAWDAAWNAVGVPLEGVAGVAHGAVSTAMALGEGDGLGVLFGVGGMATSAAQTAAAATVGAVLDAIQLQGNALMIAIESSGHAQARGQVRFARQRALKCKTDLAFAEIELNKCLFAREDDLLKREMVELDNSLIAMDPSCQPPVATPPKPSPEEEKRKRAAREEAERRRQEAEARMRAHDTRDPDDPPEPPPFPSGGGGLKLDSFFDIFVEITTDDLKRDAETAKAPGSKQAGVVPEKKGGPGKGVLIGGGAALLGGAVALAGGGGSSSTSPGGTTTTGPPPSVNLSITPTGRGLAGLTSYAFTGSGSATTWEWNFGNGSTGSGQNVNHVYAAGGRFTVTLTGRSGAQSATATGSVDVGRPMTGSWGGAFNNRNSVLTFTGAGPTLSGTYGDQFSQGTITGTISSGASFVCPCDVLVEITLPNTQFRFEGQRIGDQLIGAFVGTGFRTETTLNPQ